MSNYGRGFGLVIGFIELLQIVTTRNYSAICNSQTLKFTTALTTTRNSSEFAVSSPVVAWWRKWTMSSASVLTSLPASDYLTSHSLLQLSCL
jgi:hypothetical protein